MIGPVPYLTAAAWDDPEVARLTAAQQVELRARYAGASEPGTPPSADDVAVVLVVRDDDGTTLRLETGPRQPEVVGLYTGAGYRPVEAFGHYVHDDAEDSLFFARTLA
jgi:hypothetical protein